MGLGDALEYPSEQRFFVPFSLLLFCPSSARGIYGSRGHARVRGTEEGDCYHTSRTSRCSKRGINLSCTLFMFNRVHSLEHVENDRLTSKNGSEYSDSSGTFPQCLEYISSRGPEPDAAILMQCSPRAFSKCTFPDASSGPHDANSHLFSLICS